MMFRPFPGKAAVSAFVMRNTRMLTVHGPVHPQLHFISHLQHTVKGEQLVAQLYRCIPDRSWLYKYGRVPMSFVLSEWVWDVCSLITRVVSGISHIRYICSV